MGVTREHEKRTAARRSDAQNSGSTSRGRSATPCETLAAPTSTNGSRARPSQPWGPSAAFTGPIARTAFTSKMAATTTARSAAGSSGCRSRRQLANGSSPTTSGRFWRHLRRIHLDARVPSRQRAGLRGVEVEDAPPPVAHCNLSVIVARRDRSRSALVTTSLPEGSRRPTVAEPCPSPSMSALAFRSAGGLALAQGDDGASPRAHCEHHSTSWQRKRRPVLVRAEMAASNRRSTRRTKSR